MLETLGEPVDKAAALRAAPLLRSFTEAGIRILAATVDERSIGRGTYAFRAGEPSAGLAIIARGTLQLLPRDGGAPLGELGPGDSLGGLSLLSSGELSGERFEALALSKPGVHLKLTLALAHDVAERLREAKAPLREFLVWQISKRQVGGV
jgi:CRP-like cAMP-binding protein